jgi:preprotein translocase subunit YajC
MLKNLEAGDMVFLAEGQEGIGAVREIRKDDFVLYVENAGEFEIPAAAIVRVHDRKVIINPARLSRGLLKAIGHAHDREDPNLAG